MEPGEIERDLIPMIQRMKCSRDPIPLSTAIYQDMGLGGDDAGELLDEIHARFGTSFSSLNFPDYFPNESEVMWCHWAKKLGFRQNFKRLTVAHLVAVIERGEWFEPAQ
jgi:hypothetical protein